MAARACRRERSRSDPLAAALDRREMQPPAALLAECRHDLMRAVYRNEAPAAQACPLHARGRISAMDLPRCFRLCSAGACPLGAVALLALGFASARLTTPVAVGQYIPPSVPENVISSVRSVTSGPDGAPAGEVAYRSG